MLPFTPEILSGHLAAAVHLRWTESYSEHDTWKCLGGFLLSAAYQTPPLLKSVKIPTDLHGIWISISIHQPVSPPLTQKTWFELEDTQWIMISVERERHSSLKVLKCYTYELRSSHIPWNGCCCPTLMYPFRFSLLSLRREVSQEPFKQYQTLQAIGTRVLKNSTVSRGTNSRRRQVSTDNTFENPFWQLEWLDLFFMAKQQL